MIVVYRLSPLTYRLGRRFVHVDTFAMANLVAGRRVVPELIQDDFTAAAVAEHALSLLRNGDARERMRNDLRGVATAIGQAGASGRAARAVIEVASGFGPWASGTGGQRRPPRELPKPETGSLEPEA
jgi:lipid-A-disaccharide synthase